VRGHREDFGCNAVGEAACKSRFGHEIPFGLGISFRPEMIGIDDKGRMTWFLELHGHLPAGPEKPFTSTPASSMQLDLASRFALGADVSILAGLQTALLSGVGDAPFRGMISLSWAPRSHDKDGDGIPDDIDQCPDLPEDKDGFQDADGCPDGDNDEDGIPDKLDRCPNDPETVNGFEDDDGCPDVRGTSGPEERADRIDLKGQAVAFSRFALTASARQLLAQVAALVKTRRLAIRVEVHVALGTKSTNAAQIAAQKRRDKAVAQQRAKVIADYLATQGVTAAQVQAVGIGSDRPLGAANPTDPVNERVDIVKAQPGGAP